LKKALDPLPKKKEELIEGINRNLAKLAATITASNYPTLNPIPTAPSKSRTPSYQPGATPSNTPTHQVAATPSQTRTARGTGVSSSKTRTPFINAASATGTQAIATASQTMVNGVNITVSLSPTTGASISNSVSRASNSPQPCRQLSTKKCNQNPACYYSVLYNRCEHKGASSGSTVTRTRSAGTSATGTANSGVTSTKTRTRFVKGKTGCFSLKTQAVCNSVNACTWVASKNKCAHR